MTPLEALQATLAAEHAAVYVYGVLGGRVSTTTAPTLAERLRSSYDVHRARRDELRNEIAGLGETPVPAAAAYRVDDQSRRPADLAQAALVCEERSAETYAQLVANSTGQDRRWAITALIDAGVRQLDFGGSASPYPGLPELPQVN